MVALDYIRVCITVSHPSLPPSLPLPPFPPLPPLPPSLPSPSLPPLPSPPSLPPRLVTQQMHCHFRLSNRPCSARSHIIDAIIAHCMLKSNLFYSWLRIIQKTLMSTPHSNTRTSGTVTCLPVAAVECLKLKRSPTEWAVRIKTIET